MFETNILSIQIEVWIVAFKNKIRTSMLILRWKVEIKSSTLYPKKEIKSSTYLSLYFLTPQSSHCPLEGSHWLILKWDKRLLKFCMNTLLDYIITMREFPKKKKTRESSTQIR